MNRIRFVFGVHNHQPIGNFEFVFERAYQQAYRPWLAVLARHPRIKWNLHCSGILWEWLKKHHPEYLAAVRRQVEEGRLELLSGGYCEPILCAIPPGDQVSQIRRLNRFLRRTFGVQPRGMWLAERVWEPSLPVPITQAGIEYTLVDDTHFLSSGLTEDALVGSFVTEDRGDALRLFPISQRLRYAIPFQDPKVTVQWLERLASPEGDRALAVIDDGEKFGLWPETHRHVYEDGWLERFLQSLEHAATWLETVTCSEYLDQVPPRGRVYLPTVSYFEMSEWTLPTAAQQVFNDLTVQLPSLPQGTAFRPFLRGGIWRNFLTKYPEGNNLHKKMLRVSNQVHMAHLQKDQRRGLSRHRLRQSLKALHAGQCNDAYWHGIFGGLYLPHLRRAVYRELLTAESLLLEGPSTLRPGSGQASLRAGGGFKNSAAAVHETDFDLDGRAELLIERPDQNLYVSPHEGGTLFEWDLKPFRVNLGDVLTRRQEAYHRELEASGVRDHPSGVGGGSAKTIHERSRGADPQLSSLRVVDSARRLSLMDRFLAAETTRQDLWQGRARECGDFIHGQYAWAIHRGSMPAVVLKRQGTVQGAGGRFLIELEKVIQAIPGMGWTVNYRFQNLGTHSTPLHFAVECNWAFGTATPQEHSEHHAVSHWERPDPVTGLTLQVECHPAAGVWTFPVETLSTSEQGFEGVYQGTAVLFHWQVTASPRQWQTMHLQVAVSRLA